jgi:hypothetical protein
MQDPKQPIKIKNSYVGLRDVEIDYYLFFENLFYKYLVKSTIIWGKAENEMREDVRFHLDKFIDQVRNNGPDTKKPRSNK